MKQVMDKLSVENYLDRCSTGDDVDVIIVDGSSNSGVMTYAGKSGDRHTLLRREIGSERMIRYFMPISAHVEDHAIVFKPNMISMMDQKSKNHARNKQILEDAGRW